MENQELTPGQLRERNHLLEEGRAEESSSTEINPKKKLRNFVDKCRLGKCKFPHLVEPVVLLLSLAHGTFVILNPQYIFYRSLHNSALVHAIRDPAIFGYGDSVCSGNTSDLVQIIASDNLVEASLWTFACLLCQMLPALLLAKCLINHTEVMGRRFGLLISGLGLALSMLFYVIDNYYMLPIGFLILANIVHGVSGGWSAYLTICYTYVADFVRVEKLLFRYAIVSGVAFLGISLSSFFSGIIVNASGYNTGFSAILFCALLAVIYSIGALPESLPENDPRRNREIEFKPLSNVKQMFDDVFQGITVIRKHREQGDHSVTILSAITAVDSCLLSYGPEVSILLYVGPPLCLSMTNVSYAVTTQTILTVLGPLIGGRVFYRSYPDPLAGLVLCVSAGVGLVVQGAARSGVIVLLGLFFQFLRSMNNDLSRRMIRKRVVKEDRDTMQVAITSLVELGRFSSMVITLLLFSGLASTNPGAIFIFYGVLYFGGITLYGWLYWKMRRSSDTAPPPTRPDTQPS